MTKLTRKATTASKQITSDEVRRKVFARAIKLLSAKPRSIAELKEQLLRGRYVDESILEVVITRLREYGYLDDERFAVSYASLKVKQKPVGRRRLEQDLKLRKVDSAAAFDALEQVYGETSEEALIDRAIEKRLRIQGQPRSKLEAKSLFDHLLRQGFALEMVSEKVRALTEYDEE